MFVVYICYRCRCGQLSFCALKIGIFRELKKLQNANFSHVSFYLILTRTLEHVVCMGESRLSEVNNRPRPNVFPARVANFGKVSVR